MYSQRYSSSFSSIQNSQIDNPEQLRSVRYDKHHPINVSGKYYSVDQFYVTENAPINFRGIEVNKKLYADKHYLSPLVYADENPMFSTISDSNATFTQIDEKGFGSVGVSIVDYLSTEANVRNANMQLYDSINDPGNYPPYIHRKPLLTDFIDELNYANVGRSNRNVNTNKMLMKHAVNMDNIVKGERTAPDGSIDSLDLTIQSPKVDYNLFQPINEQFSSNVLSQSSVQSSVINISDGNATSIHQMSQTINDNGNVTSQKSAVKCRGLTMNRCVPIKFENKPPKSTSIAKSEAFVEGARSIFTPEAFTSSLGVYTPTTYNNIEPYAPPSPYSSESFKHDNPNDEAMAPDAIEAYLNTLKARATAVCFYLQHNKSYRKWAENWKFLYENLHTKNRLLFERLDESDADIAYVVNKGEEVKFRIRDEKRFIPLNIYQYVLYHEMAHMSTTELHHTPFFFQLLSIIALAAFEMGFIDLSRMSTSYYKTNGALILCRASMKTELNNACKLLVEANPKSKAYFEGLATYINKK